jgi:ATP phosphoribosyltransferase regulatory subunit
MLDRLLTHLRGVAPDAADVAILQPADPFLETAGEDLRKRMFITESSDGEVYCLRPEFTIPICLSHLASNIQLGAVCRYAYGGTVFRQVRSGANEFLQAGLEDIGNQDLAKADAGCIRDLVSTLGQAGIQQPTVILGDQNLFAVVVDSLAMPDAIAHRFMRGFGAPHLIEELIDRLSSGADTTVPDNQATRLAMAGDEAGLIAHVEGRMAAANMTVQAGRSPDAIARRMIEKVREGQFQLSSDSADILRRFLALEVPLMDAGPALAGFATDTGLEFGLAGKMFLERVNALQAECVDMSRFIYKASFGRNLEYYTGVLFEALVADLAVAGGGRYDQLCSLLGADQPVPAVGFSISLDRVEAAL